MESYALAKGMFSLHSISITICQDVALQQLMFSSKRKDHFEQFKAKLRERQSSTDSESKDDEICEHPEFKTYGTDRWSLKIPKFVIKLLKLIDKVTP